MINLKQMKQHAKTETDLFFVDIIEKADFQIEDLLEREIYEQCETLTRAYELMEEQEHYQYSKDYVKAQMAGHNDTECRIIGLLCFMTNYNNTYKYAAECSYEQAESMDAFQKFLDGYNSLLNTGSTIEEGFKWAAENADTNLGYHDF